MGAILLIVRLSFLSGMLGDDFTVALATMLSSAAVLACSLHASAVPRAGAVCMRVLVHGQGPSMSHR